MRNTVKYLRAMGVLAATAVMSNGAIAGFISDNPNGGGNGLPAPGVIGLVAAGVVIALAAARLRK